MRVRRRGIGLVSRRCGLSGPSARSRRPLTEVNAPIGTISYAGAVFGAFRKRRHIEGGNDMSMLKVIEVLAESDKSFEDAVQTAVTNAAKSVRNIKSIYIKEMEASVQNDKVSKYRINAKISFLLEG
jgi:flavin-binding protein dodecin